MRSAVGPGEGALLVAEQLALQQVLGQRGAVQRDEGRPPAGPSAWIARASSPLPVPLSPVMQHRGPRARDLPRDLIDLLHRRAGAEQALQAAAVALAQLPAQVLGLGPQRAALHRPLDRQHQLVDVDRLHQIVVGAGAHRRDRGGDLAERGGDDDRQAAVLLAQRVSSSMPSICGIAGR
jgi:hypothetical protein